MLQLIVGHRGVGKTSFLERVIAAYAAQGRSVRVFDLDREIASRSGTAISALFTQHGEAWFRDRERQTLRDLLAELASQPALDDVYIALGAGYPDDPRQVVPAALLQTTRVLWLRRLTDAQGRIFPRQATGPTRPRLAASVPPLVEYQQRFAERQVRYAAWHDDVWITPEGSEEHPQPAEAAFILAALAGEPLAPSVSLAGTLSLLPQHFARPAGFADWLDRRLRWPGLRFELRDDLLSESQLALALSRLSPARIVRSFRVRLPSPAELRSLCQKNVICDIPLELGPERLGRLAAADAPLPSLVASLHERRADESVAAASARLQAAAAALGAAQHKLAIEITDLAELESGADWAAAAPAQQIFLPRTAARDLASGPERYRWFRTLQAIRAASPLCFVREGDGTSLDQPTLCEHLQAKLLTADAGRPAFAAVLGDPVQHSRSPSQHRALFAEFGLPFVAVPCRASELADDGLARLARLGLRFAAVTAPLKRLAGAAAGLQVCNTLALGVDGIWRGANTDPDGLQALLAQLPSPATAADIAIWGGGGTLPSLQRVLPQARAFALRTGRERPLTLSASPAQPGSATPPGTPFSPRALVWAAGNITIAEHALPPAAWRPQQVFDLDYREDSSGRAYALSVDAEYSSGLSMFRAQASAQQAFFRPQLSAAFAKAHRRA